MDNFDFISGEDFRTSLESDYRELVACIEARAWKAAHVLAGSIIEAILLDYLMTVRYEGRSDSDICKMVLHDAISACTKEGFLSPRAANLSAVIQGYRNLIHPGRIVRLKESIDEQGATVARSLVDIIIKDSPLARSRLLATLQNKSQTKLSKIRQFARFWWIYLQIPGQTNWNVSS